MSSKTTDGYDLISGDWFCFCGKPSKHHDTWFNWYPCEDHEHLKPNEYQEAKQKHVDN